MKKMKKMKKMTALLLATVMVMSCFFLGGGGSTSYAVEMDAATAVTEVTKLHHFSGSDLATYQTYSDALTNSDVDGAADAKTRIDEAIAVLEGTTVDGVAEYDFYDDMQNFGEYHTKAEEPENAGDPFPLSESQTTTASWQIIFSGLRAQTSVMPEYENSSLDANSLSPKAYQLTSLQFKDYHMQHYQLLQTDGQTWNNGSLNNTDLWSTLNNYALLPWTPHCDGGINEQMLLGGKNWAGLRSGIIPSNRILKSLNFTVDMSKGKEFSVVYDWSDAQNYVYLTLTNDHKIQYNKVENGKLTTTSYFHNVWQGWNHSKTWITDYETNSSFTKSDLKFEIAWNDDLTCYVLKFPDLIVNDAGAGYHDAGAGDPLTLYLNAYVGEMALQLPQLYLRANGTSESMLQNVSLTYEEVGFTPSDEQENIRHSIQAITVFKGADLAMYTEWLAKIEEAKDVLLYQAPYSRLEAAIAKLDPNKDGTADATLYDDRKFFGEYHTLAGEPEQAGMPFEVNESAENTSAYQILWGGLQAQTSILSEYEGYVTLDKLAPKAYDLTNYLFPAYHMQHYQLLQTDGQRWKDDSTQHTMLYGGNNNNSILPWTPHRDGGDAELELVARENVMTLKKGYIPEGKVITRIEATLNGNMEGFVTDWNGAGNYVSLIVGSDGIRYEQATNGKMITPVSQAMGSGWNATYWSGKGFYTAYLQDYENNPVFAKAGLKIVIEWSDVLQCYVLEVPSAKYNATGAGIAQANQLGRKEGESIAIPLQHYSNGTKATQLTNLYLMNNANIGDILVTCDDPYVPCEEHEIDAVYHEDEKNVTYHWQTCNICGVMVGEKTKHAYGAAGYTHGGKCICGNENIAGSIKEIDFRPFILGGKVLRGTTKAEQKLRIDIDFADIREASGSDITIVEYGVAVVRATNSATPEAIRGWIEDTEKGAADGVIRKSYTDGDEIPELMKVTVNIAPEDYGKRIRLVAYVKGTAGDATVYYYSNNSKSADDKVIDGLTKDCYETGVMRIIKAVLADEDDVTGYYGKLSNASETFFEAYGSNTDVIPEGFQATGNGLSVEAYVKRYLGKQSDLETFGKLIDAKHSDYARAKGFALYLFSYCSAMPKS